MSLRLSPQKKMEFDELLIKCVKARPILYNNKKKEYKDIAAKNSAWREVGKETGQPAQECMIRWRALRDRYVRAKKSQFNSSPPSEDGASQVSKEPWPLLDRMEFLATFISHRSRPPTISHNFSSKHSTSSNHHAQLQIEESMSPSASNILQTMLQYEEEPLYPPATPMTDNEEEDAEEEDPGSSASNPPPDMGPNMMGQNDSPSPPCLVNGNIPPGFKPPPFDFYPPRFDVVRDEDELYCLSLVGPIRRLPYYKRTQAKIQIMQVLYDLEYKDSSN